MENSNNLGSSGFSESEFKPPLTIEKLCKAIVADSYDVSIKAPIETINWLNELLTVPNLYDILRTKKPDISLTDLVDKTKEYRKKDFFTLNPEEKHNIKRLNRLILEETYPQETPKSHNLIVAAGGIIWRGTPFSSEIAVIYRSRYGPEWSLPKGKYKKEDVGSLEKTARREIKEETGCKVKRHSFADFICYENKYVFFYHFKLIKETKKQSKDDEAALLVWLPPEKAIKILSHKEQRDLISKLTPDHEEQVNKERLIPRFHNLLKSNRFTRVHGTLVSIKREFKYRISSSNKNNGSSDFSVGEFKEPLTIEKLYKAIVYDNYNVSIQAPINTINWLNELLKVPNFYESLRTKRRNIIFPKHITDLVDKTKDYSKDFSNLNNDEQNTIKTLNRLLLEKTYPLETPKSQNNEDTIKSHTLRSIENLLTDAEHLMNKGSIDEAWKCIHAAKRLEILILQEKELEATANIISVEAEKLNEWRKKAIGRLLGNELDKKNVDKEKVYQAALLRDEHYDNQAYKDTLVKTHIIVLVGSIITIIMILTCCLVCKKLEFLPKDVSRVLGKSFSSFFIYKEPDISSAWIAAGIFLFGLLGGAFSAATKIPSSLQSTRIPELTHSHQLTLLRVFIGGISAIVIYLFFKSSFAPSIFTSTNSNIYTIYAISFTAGFSERLVLKAMEAVTKEK